MKEYNFKINGNDYNVAVKIQSDNEAEVLVNGASYTSRSWTQRSRKPSRSSRR